MSGGHFDYQQHAIYNLAESMENLIAELDSYGYSEATKKKIIDSVPLLRKAFTAVQRIDWLVSCDDGEETFHQRWDEEMKRIDQGTWTGLEDRPL